MAPVKSVILGSAAALASFGLVSATSCTGPVINSISYCNAVDQITYNDVGYSGEYQDVVGMDLDSCTCNYAPKAFSGPLAPLNEGLSLHFRGPLHLKQFAVYGPDSPKKKTKRSHAHQHLGRHHAHHKRALKIETVTQTIVVDPSGNTLWPKPTNTKPAHELYDNPLETPAPTPGKGDDYGKGKGDDKEDKPTFEYADDDDDVTLPDGSWVRTAYYNADSQTSNGLVFMNHRGGQGSGVFDQNCAGQSISYMTPDAKNGSPNPQILQNAPIKTRDEFIIFSDNKCTADTCGFYRPGIPAYQGFAGDKKIFVFEFSMPDDVTSDEFNNNLPAVWALNSKIPRTAQYGMKDKPCSCWGSGCGELDLFEALTGAPDMIKTHYHSKQGANGMYGGGGDPNYFKRPTDGTIKAAVYFNGDKAISITILPSYITFPKQFSGDLLQKVTGKIPGILASVFNVPL